MGIGCFVTPPLSAQGTGTLVVHAKPGRAGIFVDGKYLGPAANFASARTYTVAAGQHEVILREPRYEEYKTTIEILSGKTTTISQELQAKPVPKPPFGRIRTVGFEKFAAVYVNGAFVGHADEFNGPGQALLLNPGDYEVKIESQNGASLLEQKVSLKANEVQMLKAR
jgi:hypothetical protein